LRYELGFFFFLSVCVCTEYIAII